MQQPSPLSLKWQEAEMPLHMARSAADTTKEGYTQKASDAESPPAANAAKSTK